MFDAAVKLRCSQGHLKCYERVQFNEYRQHVTFPIISSFYGVQEKVSVTDGRQNHLTMIKKCTHNLDSSQKDIKYKK